MAADAVHARTCGGRVMAAIPPTNGFWADQFLRQINAPITRQHKVAILAWMRAENTKAVWNPLATTHRWGRSSSFNSAGVQNFQTFSDGMVATVETILYGIGFSVATPPRYADLVKLLRQPKSTAAQICKAIAASPWGTLERDLHPAWALQNYDAASARPMGRTYP